MSRQKTTKKPAARKPAAGKKKTINPQRQTAAKPTKKPGKPAGQKVKTAEKENNGMMHNYEGIEVVKRSFNPKRDYLWPIPYNQTVLNPNLEQNPNWD